MNAGEGAMKSDRSPEVAGKHEPVDAAQFADEPGSNEGAAWTEVASGRYMPRRIRGSCQGRALG